MFMTRIISKVRKELENLNFYKDGNLEIIKIKEELCVLILETDDFSYILKYSENGGFLKCVDVLNELKKGNIETGVINISDKLIIFNDYYKNPFYRMIREDDLKNEAFVLAMADWYNRFHDIKVCGCDKLLKAFSLKNITFIMKKYNLEKDLYFRYVVNNFNNIMLKLERVLPCIVWGDFLSEDIVVSNDFKNIIVLGIEKFDIGYKFFDIEKVLENFGKEMQIYFKNNYVLLNDDEVVLFKAIGDLLKWCISIENKEFNEVFVKNFTFSNNMNFLDWSKNLVEWY